MLDKNKSGLCSQCHKTAFGDAQATKDAVNDARRRNALETVQELHKLADPFRRPILEWVIDDGLTVPEAAKCLSWKEGHFRKLLEAGQSPTLQTVRLLAERLGGIQARGWDVERWKAELEPARPGRDASKRSQDWGKEILEHPERLEGDPLARALAEHAAAEGLGPTAASRIAHVDPGTFLSWIGRNPRRSLTRPTLNRVAGAAAVLAWPSTTAEAIEARMVDVFRLIADGEKERPEAVRKTDWEEWRECSPAGRLILRRLWELDRGMTWLAPETGLDPKTLKRYIRLGEAKDTTRGQVTSTLDLAEGESQRLVALTDGPDAAGWYQNVADSSRRRMDTYWTAVRQAQEDRQRANKRTTRASAGGTARGEQQRRAALKRVDALCATIRAAEGRALTQSRAEGEFGVSRPVFRNHAASCSYH